ncbi:MAG: hypothetical protein JEZ14_14565 [Marinilabiliaceae bacterium]|nr:hypothetical protein [Marinilabiliaceae bacterium]
MKRFISILLLSFVMSLSFAQQHELEIPYTQADRDRLVRVETRLDNVEKSMDNLRVELREGQASIRNLIYGLIYSIFGLIGVLVALVIWDRRTAIRPVASALDLEKERVSDEVRIRKKLIKALKEAAEKDTNIREAMKHAGLL